MDFSDEEKRDMLECYYANYSNSVIASAIYFQKYPERQQPYRAFFSKLDRNISLYGSFRKTRKKYGDCSNNNENEEILEEQQKAQLCPNLTDFVSLTVFEIPMVTREFVTACIRRYQTGDITIDSISDSASPLLSTTESPNSWTSRRRRASTFHEGDSRDESPLHRWRGKRGTSFHEIRSTDFSEDGSKSEPSESNALPLLPPCTCPYFGDKPSEKCQPPPPPAEVKIIPSDQMTLQISPKLSLEVEKQATPIVSPVKRSMLTKTRNNTHHDAANNIMVTWESRKSHRRGSSFGSTRTTLTTNQRTPLLLRRAATLRHNGHTAIGLSEKNKNPSSPCLLQKYNYNSATTARVGTIRSHHSPTHIDCATAVTVLVPCAAEVRPECSLRLKPLSLASLRNTVRMRAN
ncbi:hypothetical protein MML48_3g00012690 [Holotrichia oblita]|uniref:Uncharacterized protein n=1 Tax=Holotrichia oblita TaxID=644536 RepID=A0ACB9TF02_HOLOL|nr:hypothetical protein MML48_3g00012690 [Holotrichia oblita]